MSLSAGRERGGADAFSARVGCSDGVPDGALITICDTAQCSGSFLLSYFLARHLSSAHRTCRGTGAEHAPRCAETGQQSSGASTSDAAAGESGHECRGLVCLLATAQRKAHYLSVAKKMGVMTTQLEQRGQLGVIESLSLAQAMGDPVDAAATDGTPAPQTLRLLYGRVAETVQQQQRENEAFGGGGQRQPCGEVLGNRMGEPDGSGEQEDWQCRHRPCVLVDDAWFLEAAAEGATTGGALDFLHHCRTLGGGKHGCSVVALVHADDANPSLAGNGGGSMRENPVLASLLSSSDVTIHVRPLPSGHAAELHGEIDIIHRTGKLLHQSDPQEWVHMGLQFNISEKCVMFMA